MSVAAKAYTATASSLHWMSGITMIGCIGSVLQAQNAPKGEKGAWMWRHKSLGLLTGIIVAPRLAYRIVNRSAVSTSRTTIRSNLLKSQDPNEFLMMFFSVSSSCSIRFKTYLVLLV